MKISKNVPVRVRVMSVFVGVVTVVFFTIALYDDIKLHFFSEDVAADVETIIIPETQVPLASGPVPLYDLSQGYRIEGMTQSELTDFFRIDHTIGNHVAFCGNTIWDESNVSFEKGEMELSLNPNQSAGENYWLGAQVSALSGTSYGLYEAEIKPYAKTPGVVTAFFLYSFSTLDEIDIEFNSRNPYQVEFNYFAKGIDLGTTAGLVTIDLDFDAYADYHTYGFYYGPDIVVWYIDGEEAYRTDYSRTPETVNSKLIAMMSIWAGGDKYVDWLGQTVVPVDGTTISAYFRAVRYTPVDSMNIVPQN